jgi:hypothetical protein
MRKTIDAPAECRRTAGGGDGEILEFERLSKPCLSALSERYRRAALRSLAPFATAKRDHRECVPRNSTAKIVDV